MTETPYLDLPYERVFEATAQRVASGGERAARRVVLDRTLFYPEGGGQPSDTGTLELADDETDASEWRVTDVQKKDTIYHALEPADGDRGDGLEPLEEGATVTGRLDWDRRYAHMKYHTAQHLLSALLLTEYDAPTTGNQLYDDRARIDCEYDRFTEEDFADVEAWMNARIDDGLPVRWYEMDRERAEAELDPERTRIHLLPDSISEVRIVEIAATPEDSSASDTLEPLDQTACAGTHVENTDELGEFEVTGRETKGSDEERLKFRLT
jgi:misacylated tRNA(Ala) deacylase